MLAQYSGWQSVVERYSVYGRDQTVTNYAAAIRNTLADDECPWGRALRLFRPQQRDLGQMAVVRVGESATPAFYAVPFDEFVQELRQGDFPGRDSLMEFLEIIRVAKTDEDLSSREEACGDGRSRLAEVQIVLVYLLEHLEAEEGISLWPSGKRRDFAITRPIARPPLAQYSFESRA
jgi:hypothetical protein